MSVTTNGDRQRLLDALREAWSAETGVRDFGLQYVPRTIEERYGSWIVPVAVGATGGSAYDLLRILDRLQESVERRSSLDVSMFFDPRLVPESGGVN